MKKILVASAALLLTTGIAAPVVHAANDAEPGVKFSGDARLRAVYADDMKFGTDAGVDRDGNSRKKSSTFLHTRMRLTAKGTAAGGAYAIGRIRLLDNNVENNDTDNRAGRENHRGGGNIWVEMAYLGIPFSDNVTFETGKYRESYGTGFFYNDIPMGGIRGILKFDNVVVNPFVNWMSEGQNLGGVNAREDNDSILFGLHVGAQINDNWKLGGLVGYMTDDRQDSDYTDAVTGRAIARTPHKGWIADLYVTGKEGNFGFTGEFAYNDKEVRGFNEWRDDFNTDMWGYGYDSFGYRQDDDGFGFYLKPSYTIDALTLALNFGMTFGNFSPAQQFGFIMVGADHPLTTVNVGDFGDWIWAGLVAKYAVSENLSVTGNLVYAHIDGDDGMIYRNRTAKTLSRSGSVLKNAWEISGRLDYAISKGAEFTWFAGVLIPDFEDAVVRARAVDDDTVFGTYGEFRVKF